MTSPEPAIRRVVVAGDAASGDGEGPRLGAQLAARWGAALHGLFVEDSALLALAGLPFVQEIRADRAPPRPLDRAAIETAMDALARRARGALAAAAAAHGVGHSFEILRASIPDDVTAFREGDFLVLEGLCRPLPAGLGLASPWARLAGRTAHPHLLLRAERTRQGAVALLAGDEAAGRSPALACRLAEIEQRRLLLLELGGGTGLQRQGEPGLAAATRLSLPAGQPEAIGRALAEHGARVLVMSPALSRQPALAALIARTALDVAVA
jgi:hypothetical protein